jgi:hypothetical protein
MEAIGLSETLAFLALLNSVVSFLISSKTPAVSHFIFKNFDVLVISGFQWLISAELHTAYNSLYYRVYKTCVFLNFHLGALQFGSLPHPLHAPLVLFLVCRQVGFTMSRDLLTFKLILSCLFSFINVIACRVLRRECSDSLCIFYLCCKDREFCNETV